MKFSCPVRDKSLRLLHMLKHTAVLLILDGFGINPNPEHNAIQQARMPHYTRLLRKYPHTQLQASESFVGLPGGFMGNSEVGHLNIGAGRVVFQDFSLISHAIEEGSFSKTPAFLDLFQKIRRRPGASLHLMGLLSDGGVHSHLSHLFALLELAKAEGIPSVWIHAFMDGRDTSPTSGKEFIRQTEAFCRKIQTGKIATVSGRFYAMDRDNRWERTEKAYDALVLKESESIFSSAEDFVSAGYSLDVTDEFLVPGVAEEYAGMKDGDGVLFFNFRADRARQLTRALTQQDFISFKRKVVPALSGFVCMTPYDDSLKLPSAFEKTKVKNTLGEVIANEQGKQLRIAETEKYAHVTYFFNGGEERIFPNEKRVLIPSPRDVKTYDLKPEMSVYQVTDKLLEELNAESYVFAVVNFANPDMVGHTGNLPAAVKALESVDACLGRIVQWIEANDALLILTADHGNCEMMQDAKGSPLTSHTLLPVPLILVDPKRLHAKLKKGSLCDIAPTLLTLLGVKIPPEMTGKNLID